MKQLSGLEQVIADRWLIFLTFKMNQMRLGRGDGKTCTLLHLSSLRSPLFFASPRPQQPGSAAGAFWSSPTSMAVPAVPAEQRSPPCSTSSRLSGRYSEESSCLLVFVPCRPARLVGANLASKNKQGMNTVSASYTRAFL